MIKCIIRLPDCAVNRVAWHSLSFKSPDFHHSVKVKCQLITRRSWTLAGCFLRSKVNQKVTGLCFDLNTPYSNPESTVVQSSRNIKAFGYRRSVTAQRGVLLSC